MTFLAVAVLVIGFVLLLKGLSLPERGREVLSIAHSSVATMRDPALDDDTKEVTLQRNSIHLFKLFFLLSAGGAVAVFLPLGIVWSISLTGMYSMDEVMAAALSPWVFVLGGLAALVVFMGSGGSPEDGYGFWDRFLHRLAFRTLPAQIALADMENNLNAKQLATCPADRPVFITALPRAGTTLLLECCARLPEFASHCYRDMPYVLIPCLWQRFSGAFRKDLARKPRAHGDGMEIDLNSPEALEEVLWRTFWKKKYRREQIALWQADEAHEEFLEFFHAHMRKIVWLRRGATHPSARYVSKNNLNITRIEWLQRHLPDATLLIPFRDPVQQAASLLRQHLNFLEQHAADPFTREYMRDIGHYEFGDNLRPVCFGDTPPDTAEAVGLAFWLRYWMAGYSTLLEGKPEQLHFVDFDALCAEPETGLAAVAKVLDVSDPEPLLANARTIRAATPHEVDLAEVPEALVKNVRDLHDRLQHAALR